ncbi:TetR/AcrR family transcriptional regulator [Mycobacterium sp. MMS18-G62]
MASRTTAANRRGTAERQRAPAWGADLPITDEQARERLITAAEACFAERGPNKTRMTHVAAKAGVHRTTVYAYFPNIDAILAACFVRANMALVATVEFHFEQDGLFVDRLINAVLAGLDFARNSPAILSMTTTNELARTFHATERSTSWRAEIIGQLANRFAEAPDGEIRTDVPPQLLAEWVVRVCWSLIEEPGRPGVGGDEGLLQTFLPGAIRPQLSV